MQKGIAEKVIVQLKAYTKKELRLMYNISPHVLREWLRAIPETEDTGRKNWLDIGQVEALLKVRGVPGERHFN